MKKKLINYFSLFLLATFIIITFSITLRYYNVYRTHQINNVRNKAEIISGILNNNRDDSESLNNVNSGATRISLISSDGVVLYDTDIKAETLGNHSDRKEVIKAMQNGTGEAIRYSDSIDKTLYY